MLVERTSFLNVVWELQRKEQLPQMPPPATEVATIPLKAGAFIEDLDSPAGKIWSEMLETASQQEGYQRAYYGRELEDPRVVQLLVDWDSYEAHERFMKSPSYGPFYEHLLPIFDGDVTMVHVNFEPHPPTAAVVNPTAPVTEVLTAYLAEKDEAYAARSREFAGILLSHDAVKGVSTGWTVEDVTHPSLGDGKRGYAYVSVLAWESKEKHVAFRESQVFKDNINLVREGLNGVAFHHTTFVQK